MLTKYKVSPDGSALEMAGDKSGVSEKRFYKQLIQKADERFDDHLTRLKKKEEEEDQ